LEPALGLGPWDALRVKIREDNVVRNKAVYLALGVRRDGTREVLGLWIETTEGAKFWMKVGNVRISVCEAYSVSPTIGRTAVAVE